ncbi:hypothetical protein Sar04_45730 [Salinispora arenicola]|uniref:Secreted protein n=1 Tax=Salinispora arenicola TaxID=168697 RepID=A0ABQ4JY40_SALAC|nr:hypothetical protein Sar04_45730 [Salinispora arenicola]
MVLPSTVVLARTTPVTWSQAVITCRAGVSVVREPRRALPSTAIARSAVEMVAVARLASQLLIAAVSSCGSMACNSRRIIASGGRRSGAMPRARAVVAGTSATHSAIAAYER